MGGFYRFVRCGMFNREGYCKSGRFFRGKRYFKLFWIELLLIFNFICDFDFNNMYISCDL